MVLENNVQKILFRQLDNFWDGWNKEVISIKISQALGEMQENYLMSASTRLYKDGDMVFNPMHTVTWAIFYIGLVDYFIWLETFMRQIVYITLIKL